MNEKIKELLDSRRFAELKPLLVEMEPVDIAIALEDVEDKDIPLVFRLLPKELAAETFVEFDSDTQEMLIQAFTDKELKAVLDELFVDDTVDIIEEMPANVVKRILQQSDVDTRKEINEILQYPDDSAGSIMTTEYVSLRKNMTVLEAFQRIKKTGIDKETVYTCYVTDPERHLVGYVSIRMLLMSEMTDTIDNIMDENCIYVETLEDKEEVAKRFAKYDFVALPVVDKEKRLVGIITVDDAMDVMEEAVTEDMQIMGAVAPIEDEYLKTPIWKHWSKRIFWLLILMISGIASGLIIQRYENMVAALPLLVAFIPRLMDTGGNCGAQSSTMVIRGLALEEVTPKDIGKVVLKELGIGSMVGVTLAIANIGVIWLMYGSSNPANVVWALCLAFGLTIMAVVLVAKVLGCSLPLLAKVCRLDPALMASPIITTLVDICAVTLYFKIVSWIVLPILA